MRNLYLSLDPYMRMRMDDGKSYAPPVQIGDVMVGGTVGEVIESRDPRFKKGDMVGGRLGWQLFAIAEASALRRVDTRGAPLSTALGVIGMPGVTAWYGLLRIGDPRPGETVVVSAASGAVGSVVGQIARLEGMSCDRHSRRNAKVRLCRQRAWLRCLRRLQIGFVRKPVARQRHRAESTYTSRMSVRACWTPSCRCSTPSRGFRFAVTSRNTT